MDKRTLHRMDVHYALLQSLNWMGYAVIWGCMAVLLQYLGFSNAQIGLVSSAAMVLSMVAQPLLASLVDRSERIDSGGMSALLTVAGVIGAAALWIFQKNHGAVTVIYALIGLIMIALQPFLNAAAMEYILRGVPLHYSTDRSMGSATYAIGVLATGWLVENLAPPTVVLPAFIVIWTVLAVATLLFRYPKPQPAASDGKAAPKAVSLPALLRKYPDFTLLLVGCAFMMIAHNAYTAYTIQLVRRVGAGETVMGISMAIAAGIELPAMVLFSRLRRKLSLEWLMRLCALSTFVRVAIYLAVPTVWGVYVSSVLQFFSYGLFPPVTVYYVMERLDSANQNKGQTLLLTTAGAVGSCVGMPVAGALSDRLGTDGMLWFLLLAAAMGTVVVFFATRRAKSPEEK